MADAIDSLGGEWLEEAGATPDAEPVVEARAPEPVTPADEGRYEEPQGEPEPVKEPTDSRQVPLAALKEEREKRQALERRLNEFEARVGQAQPNAQQQPQARAPDPYEDPEGYNAYVQSTVAQTEWNMRAEMSGQFAEQKHGRETVEAAIAWAQAEGAKDPTLGQRVTLQRSPVEYVVQEYKRSQTLQALGEKSPEDFAREYAEQQGWIVSQPGVAGAAPIQKPSSPTPPKSLSQAPGNGGIGKSPSGADWSEVKFALG